MKTDKKKSDFELIMEAIDALPSGPYEWEPVDLEKIRVIGDRGAFRKAIDKENYQIKSLLGHFIDGLDEILTYYVSTASASGNEAAKNAMTSALKGLPVSPDDILQMLFCICHNGSISIYDIYSVSDFILELPDNISIDWGTVFDEDIPETQVKVILVAAG